MRPEIWKLALRNAIFHSGRADVNAVMRKYMAINPHANAKRVIKTVQQVVREVNELPLDAQKTEAIKLKVDLEPVLKKEREELPELPRVSGKVVTRFAPNPNGPLHLGHARAAVLNYLYARMYDGRFILRYDDTDPRTKKPIKEVYKWILDDLRWLGIKPDLVIYQSDRMSTYLELAYELLKMGKAYVCTCKTDEWRKLRDARHACPCRELDVEKQEEGWRKMQDEYKEGEAILRIKTDLKHPDPAVRDWPAIRIIERPNHPRIGNEYRLWPLYNFASGIDDHELGVTHILRAQEHSVNTTKQKFLYNHLGWEYPVTIHHGRLSLEGVVLSTSKAAAGIKSREFAGWDDPRLGTLRALRRRGFQAKAIVNLIHDIGPNTADVSISMSTLAAQNKQLVDFDANRHFFVSDPVRIKVSNPAKVGMIELPLHPDDEKRGVRKIKVGEHFFIERADFKKFEGHEVRLKELYNVIIYKNAECTGEKVLQKMPKIQWVPQEDKISVNVVMPDAKIIKGVGEPAIAKEKVGAVIQFQRFGFVRIDSVSKECVTCYFGHK